MENAKIITSFPKGMVTPPPSKSLAHRAVICAALAACGPRCGESIISNIALSEDIGATLGGIQALGARWEIIGGELRILPGNRAAAPVINCGESGSTLRFLLPLAAVLGEQAVFRGRGRLMERPLDVYERLFAEANISLVREGNTVIMQGTLQSGVFSLPGDISSQFVSGLLLALPLLKGDSEILLTTALESKPYVDMTIAVMRLFGVKVTWQEPFRIQVPGGQCYCPSKYEVEADYSQAAYFLAAAALGQEVRCTGLNPNSMQGDRAMLDVLKDMGAQIIWKDGAVEVKAKKLRCVNVDAREIPDLVPPIAALCCFCEGKSQIINAGRLRLKESDRLSAMATELQKLGANVEESPDSLCIEGAPTLAGGRVDSHNDHRIAMSLALAAIRCKNTVELCGAGSVRKSYPNFWEDFEREEKQNAGNMGE